MGIIDLSEKRRGVDCDNDCKTTTTAVLVVVVWEEMTGDNKKGQRVQQKNQFGKSENN